ncbi:pyridoxamine 5'-phosphate oxidase family protein [Ancylobacter pratisalsi]|uniref:Pyridoxamine 5'-phosphate oxidase family protein n=1 Tax=Ancylobacter pratisalsi TaxID=1745854 RepID=A0A6P1YT23_9HYPH|nr:pyridoxamine 5'-phosphate oxidase family protein [Ancylobacter pratisalsi]QIB34834.1 pyridoxamine 5'-phosphate oxidase family protein [Ancylobacter pratisalsi]
MDSKTTEQAIDKVWDMMDDIRTCMLVSKHGLTLRSRPMHAMVARDEGCVWFLSDKRGHKDEELESDPQSALIFADKADRNYLSVSGESEVMHDPAKIDELWNEAASTFWPRGKNDPNIQVLRFIPESAEYWDGPSNSVLVALKMAAARMQGRTPDLGDNRKVPLD